LINTYFSMHGTLKTLLQADRDIQNLRDPNTSNWVDDI
jgi:hypothetical protein